MQTSIKRRLLAYALAVAVLIGASAYRPQKVDAVALTSTAAAVALVAAVMTSCGVTYWASTQEDAVSYLGGKIETYLGTLTETYSTVLDWLGINSISDAFAILNGGVLSVPTLIANKILDFVAWFNTTENVVSGGNAVSTVVTAWQGQPLPVFDSEPTRAKLWESGFIAASSNNNASRNLFGASVGSVYVVRVGEIFYVGSAQPFTVYYHFGTEYSGTKGNNTGTLSSGIYLRTVTSSELGSDREFYVINYASRNEAIAALQSVISDGVPKVTSVTPSSSVVVPSLEEGQSLVVTTTAPIADGDTNEEACQAILDTVVSQDGLSSTNTTEGAGAPTAWTWLSDILTDIKGALDDIWLEISSLPSAIGNAIGTAIQNAVSGISATVTNIYTFLQNTISGIGQKVDDVKGAILGLPSSIVSGVSSVLSSAFVPSQTYVATFVASLYSTFDNHFSILSYPFSLLGTFITKIGTIGSSDPIFTWGNIYEPFSGKLLIAAGTYNLNTALQNQTFAYAHTIYMIVIKGLLSFQFVSFLYAWFCDVFHMKNSDFDSPFDEDGDED